MKLRLAKTLCAAVLVATFAAATLRAAEPAAETASSGAPTILLDKPPKIVEYQLKRLSNAQLLAVERKTDHAKYAPVYQAILTRKGVERKFRDEAVDALAKINKSNPVVELLATIGRVDPEEKGTLRELVGMLMAQKPAELASQREQIEPLAKGAENPIVKQVALAALAAADGKPDAAWKLASEKPEDLRLLLGGVALIPDGKVRGAFYPMVQPLVASAPDEETQVAAIDAIGSVPGKEADVFKQLGDLVRAGPGPKRDAAVRSLRRIPASKWPKPQISQLARDVVKAVEQTPAEKRTDTAAVQAVQLGNDLANAMPPAMGAPIRKSLRALGVRVVALTTLREQMQYDLKYFVVEAGKPVQVVLVNEDGMQHNFVLTAPGKMQEVAMAGGAISPDPDPKVKPFVPPDNKNVLHATNLAQPEETLTISFTAPEKPGEYPYVCTYPGHWVKMYGVMLVVPNIEQWEKAPKAPIDPLNNKPFDSQKNELMEGHGGHAAHAH
jgi:azurin